MEVRSFRVAFPKRNPHAQGQWGRKEWDRASPGIICDISCEERLELLSLERRRTFWGIPSWLFYNQRGANRKDGTERQVTGEGEWL